MSRAFFHKTLVLATLFGMVSGLPAWSDRLHFYDGSVMDGKIYRTTGDLITMKGKWGQKTDVKRLTLANRQDVVKTAKEEIVGEIVYMDVFRVEVHTPTGFKKVLRMFVDEISMGGGFSDVPAVGTPHLVDGREESAFRPVHFQPVPVQAEANPDKPVVRRPSEQMAP